VPPVAGLGDPHLEHDPPGLPKVSQNVNAMVKGKVGGGSCSTN
jgi:hypothetical protein